MDESKPGQVITPQGSTPEPQPPVVPPAPPQSERPTKQAPDESPAPSQQTEPPAQAAPESGWQFRQEATDSFDDPAVRPLVPPTPQVEVTWKAAEFIAHDKSPAWYGALALGGLVATGLAFLITKDKITTGIIAFALIAFGAFAARKPKEQAYAINQSGIHVGNRTYEIGGYKSFSIAEEGSNISLVFMPLKRFMPPLTIYVTPDVEDRVVTFLSQQLPFEQHRQDAVDSLLRRIRF